MTGCPARLAIVFPRSPWGGSPLRASAPLGPVTYSRPPVDHHVRNQGQSVEYPFFGAAPLWTSLARGPHTLEVWVVDAHPWLWMTAVGENLAFRPGSRPARGSSSAPRGSGRPP